MRVCTGLVLILLFSCYSCRLILPGFPCFTWVNTYPLPYTQPFWIILCGFSHVYWDESSLSPQWAHSIENCCLFLSLTLITLSSESLILTYKKIKILWWRWITFHATTMHLRLVGLDRSISLNVSTTAWRCQENIFVMSKFRCCRRQASSVEWADPRKSIKFKLFSLVFILLNHHIRSASSSAAQQFFYVLTRSFSWLTGKRW